MMYLLDTSNIEKFILISGLKLEDWVNPADQLGCDIGRAGCKQK